MKSKLLVFVGILFFSCASVLVTPTATVSAQSPQERSEAIQQPNSGVPAFIALVGIPGMPDMKISDMRFGDYVNTLYRLAISVAALFAVFKIVIAGVKYMLDDIVTHKEEAKNDIRGALIGLLVILAAYIILNTINTDITKNMIAVNPLTGLNSSSTFQNDFNNALNACPDYSLNLGQRCVTREMSKADCDKLQGSASFYLYVHWYGVPGVQGTCSYVQTFKPGDEIDFVFTGKPTVDKSICEHSPEYKLTIDSSGVSHCTYLGGQNTLPPELAQYCTDENQCYSESCSVYGKDYSYFGYSLFSFGNCANICTDTYRSKYDSTSNSCIMIGPVASIDKNIMCTGQLTQTYDDYGLFTTHDNRCTDASNQCYRDLGYVISSDGITLVCRIPG